MVWPFTRYRVGTSWHHPGIIPTMLTEEERQQKKIEAKAKWRAADREKQREYGRQYRERNRQILRDRAKAYKARHPEQVAAYRLSRREWHRKYASAAYQKLRGEVLRGEVLSQYGGRCVCCDEANQCFLSIDHTRNDGAKHRRGESQEYHGSGVSIYRWLKQHRYPKDGFQILCYNCNCSKQHDPVGHRKAHPRAHLIDGLGELPQCHSIT